MIVIGDKQFDLDREDVIQNILEWVDLHPRDIVIDENQYTMEIVPCTIGGQRMDGVVVRYHGDYMKYAMDPIPPTKDFHGTIEMALRGIVHRGEFYKVKIPIHDYGETFSYSGSVFAQVPWRNDEDGYIMVTRPEDVMPVEMAI